MEEFNKELSKVLPKKYVKELTRIKRKGSISKQDAQYLVNTCNLFERNYLNANVYIKLYIVHNLRKKLSDKTIYKNEEIISNLKEEVVTKELEALASEQYISTRQSKVVDLVKTYALSSEVIKQTITSDKDVEDVSITKNIERGLTLLIGLTEVA